MIFVAGGIPMNIVEVEYDSDSFEIEYVLLARTCNAAFLTYITNGIM